MKCKDCKHLVKTESVECVGFYDLHCDRYNISHYPIPKSTLKHLNCVENQVNFDEVVRGKS